MKINLSAIKAGITATVLFLSANAAAEAPLQTVKALDLARFSGTWHQIAFLPNWFQRKCVADSSAHYSLNFDATVRVLNRCRRGDGSFAEADGIARRHVDYNNPAILQVRFAPRFLSAFPMVWGDYWVIALDEDYRTALVGTPSRQYLWLLARSTALEEADYAHYVALAKAQGFDIAALRRE